VEMDLGRFPGGIIREEEREELWEHGITSEVVSLGLVNEWVVRSPELTC
jgi:hypothetical protein